uniref:RanBP-type and C3HC4-type zinc finger-containing protein 1 n=1 Tax=Arion vulgaris TaxID=1028688 RepID=A0A0B7BCW6_9EUPU
MSETLFKLGEKLSAAIQAGDAKEAASLAVQFSSLKLKLDINIKREELDLRNKEHEFSVRVHVEDRLSDGFYFNLQVKSSDTIQDLKKKVMLKYNFPEEVQRWIIGKKIPENENKLSQCSVKGSGHTLYLYLVTARSVGLSKQDYDMRHRALQSPEPLWPVPLSPLETQSHSSSNNTSPALASSPVLGMEEIGLGHSTYGMTRQTSRRSLNSGSNIIQEMLMGPNLSSLATLDSRQKSASLENAANGMELWGNEFIESSIASTHSTYRLREPSPTHPPETEKIGWVCPKCTFINLPVRPGCEMCTGPKPPGYKVPSGYHMTPEERMLLENDQLLEKMTREAQEREVLANYEELIATDNLDVILNTEAFQCPICFDDVDVEDGIVLRECLHMFCRGCLTEAVRFCEDAILKCPYQEGLYACQCVLQEREIRALVPEHIYLRYLQRGLDQAESQTINSYHCKTADCHGWCVYEDLVNFFKCPVCKLENCLTCKAIHEGLNCKQYQDDLKLRANNDIAAKQTAEMLQKLVADGEAMHCPQCHVVLQKKGGCDWIKCSICKTEICWVTKGPRWGPLGDGDLSGGCHCRTNGQKCHPNCVNCH